MGILKTIRDTQARIDASSARKLLEDKLANARRGPTLAKVGGLVYLFHDRVVVMHRPPEKIMLSADTKAYVDTAGGISSRVTATRLVATGPFALAMPKKSDGRELYLYIEDPAGVAMAELSPAFSADARKLTVALANAVIHLDAAKAEQAELVASLETQLAALDAPREVLQIEAPKR